MGLMGYLGEGTKVTKGRHQGGLRRDKQAKIEVKGYKRGWLCVNRLLVNALV